MGFPRSFRNVLLAALAALNAHAFHACATDAPAPNIVFVLLDDVRFDDIVDHPFAELPNIQRLANEGASFTKAFTSAPLCSPSRAVFLTGQYPHRNGIVDNGERSQQSHQLVTFPKLLQGAGYRTGFFGKWHMGHEDDSPRPGFDRWVSFVGQGVYFDPQMNIDGLLSQASGYMTDILTDHAVSFINQNSDSQPFLAFIAHKAAHPEVYPDYVRTFPPAPGDESLYTGAKLHHSLAWRADTAGKPALARVANHSDLRSPEGGLPDDIVFNRLRMLSAVDRGIGRLLETLEAKDLLDDTVFVVTSDQGFFYGEFGLAQERRLAYEPSIQIPLIVRYPVRVAAGTRPDTLLSNADLAPTLLTLGGAAVPTNLDGVSLLPVLGDPDAKVRDDILIEYYSDKVFPRLQSMGYTSLRTEQYKYIRYKELEGMDELYDLQADPHELQNLLPDRAPMGLIEKLATQIDYQLNR